MAMTIHEMNSEYTPPPPSSVTVTCCFPARPAAVCVCHHLGYRSKKTMLRLKFRNDWGI